jgi:VanZ family protein
MVGIRLITCWPILLSYGVLIEFYQLYVANREASWLDVIADALGMLVYLFLRPVIS